MSELRERLERLGESGAPAGADVIWKRASHRIAPPSEAPAELDARPRRRRTPIVVALSLVVALLAAGVVILTRTTTRSRPSVVAGPTPSSTQSALAFEHTQTQLATLDSQRGLEVTDVDQGATQTLVPGPMNITPCNTCPLVRRGNAVFFARDGRAYVLDDLQSPPRDLGPASFVFGGSDNRTVWTATTSRDSGTVTRPDDHRNPTGGPWPIPDGYHIFLGFLPKEIDGRILLALGPVDSRSLYAWDPEGGAFINVGNALFTIDTYQRAGNSAGTLAWVPQESCRSRLRRCALAISDISSKGIAKNHTRAIDPPHDSNGFIGGGAFSPDGHTLAAFVEAPPTRRGPAARLVLVDVESGAIREVRGGQISIGESYGFATWDPTGRWLFFGGFPQPLLVHRDGTDDAVALNLPASYTSVALATAPHPAPPAATATRVVDDGASTVAELRRRRLNAPHLQPDKVCPRADVNLRLDGVGPAVEAGPVATATFSEGPALWYGDGQRNGSHRAKVLWLVRADQPKTVIVRGKRIDAPGAVEFYNAGRVSRTYSLAGDATSTAPPDWRDIPSSVYVRPSGCYALQVDGPNFQSIFVFAARPTRERNVTNANPATQGT